MYKKHAKENTHKPFFNDLRQKLLKELSVIYNKYKEIMYSLILECGHKVRPNTFKLVNEIGTCPRHICLHPLSETDKASVAHAYMCCTTPIWELNAYGRPATEAEKIARDLPKGCLPTCSGITAKGKQCTKVVLRSNGEFCCLHVPRVI